MSQESGVNSGSSGGESQGSTSGGGGGQDGNSSPDSGYEHQSMGLINQNLGRQCFFFHPVYGLKPVHLTLSSLRKPPRLRDGAPCPPHQQQRRQNLQRQQQEEQQLKEQQEASRHRGGRGQHAHAKDKPSPGWEAAVSGGPGLESQKADDSSGGRGNAGLEGHEKANLAK